MAAAMKRLSMFARRRPTNNDESADTPTANATKAVKAFCETDASTGAGEEVLHLPALVEAAESSPQAAGAACYQIRKFLSKDFTSTPQKQYNATMLIRILADNPGQTFTRHIDDKFCKTIKDLLKTNKDPSVQQIMRETLSALERDKGDDGNLSGLLAMWKKEKDAAPTQILVSQQNQQRRALQGQSRFSQRHSMSPARPRNVLPPPEELSSRIEEAKTSAKLLIQFAQSTPAAEFEGNDLIKEFAERCLTAQRDLQGYMNATNPSPDEGTLQTLIETCEQLSLASSRHQRSLLAARRETGRLASVSPPQENVQPVPGAGAQPTQQEGFQSQTLQQQQPMRSESNATTHSNGYVPGQTVTPMPPHSSTRPAPSATSPPPEMASQRQPYLPPMTMYDPNDTTAGQPATSGVTSPAGQYGVAPAQRYYTKASSPPPNPAPATATTFATSTMANPMTSATVSGPPSEDPFADTNRIPQTVAFDQPIQSAQPIELAGSDPHTQQHQQYAPPSGAPPQQASPKSAQTNVQSVESDGDGLYDAAPRRTGTGGSGYRPAGASHIAAQSLGPHGGSYSSMGRPSPENSYDKRAYAGATSSESYGAARTGEGSTGLGLERQVSPDAYDGSGYGHGQEEGRVESVTSGMGSMRVKDDGPLYSPGIGNSKGGRY